MEYFSLDDIPQNQKSKLLQEKLQEELEQHQNLAKKNAETEKTKNTISSFGNGNKVETENITTTMEEDMKEKGLPEYESLFEDALYEEAFILLEKRLAKIDDLIESRKHIKKFFELMDEDEHLAQAYKTGKVYALAKSLASALQEPFMVDARERINDWLETDTLSMLYTQLVLNNNFEKAKLMMPYVDTNLGNYPETISKIASNNNVDALRFFCENMKNIHFNDGALLRACHDMSPATLSMLIEEFEFDINEQNKEDPKSDSTKDLMGISIFNKLAYKGNIKNFKHIVENYGHRINLNQTFVHKNKNVTFFDMVDINDNHTEFFEPLMAMPSLRSTYIERIAQSLFAKPTVINKCAQTDVYALMFSHPNFNHQAVNLGQGYTLYGLLSRMGISSKEESNQGLVRSYMKVLEAYVENHPDDNVPSSANFHIVGAAVHVASLSESLADACNLIMRRYQQYINQPNPSGKLPIQQVEKDTLLYRLMVNHGAIPPEPPQSFWNTVASYIIPGKKSSESHRDAVLRVAEEMSSKKSSESPKGSLKTLRQQMREDFREMKEYLKNDLCDPIIKFKCENMFLKADHLVMMMDRHSLKNSFEDMHFLGENFSNYLNTSLKKYIEACQAAYDFTAPPQKNDLQHKVNEAKNLCMQQVNLLTEQIELISHNTFTDANSEALKGLRVQSKFLEAKLGDRGYDVEHYASSNNEQEAPHENKSMTVFDDNNDDTPQRPRRRM